HSLEDARATHKRRPRGRRRRKTDAELRALGDLDALPHVDDLVAGLSPPASGPAPIMPFGLGSPPVKPAFDDPNASDPFTREPKVTGWPSDDGGTLLPPDDPFAPKPTHMSPLGGDPFAGPLGASDPFGGPAPGDPFSGPAASG